MNNFRNNEKIRGVNLGGWLVIEKWITPTLFKNLKAVDETSFCLELGEKAEEKLKHHRKNFIKEKDFEWIAKIGLNAVRIPVGHWIFGNVEPYIKGIESLDFAAEQAEKQELKVFIDLHAAPGGQNSWDHSGLSGKMEWHKNKENTNRTLEVVKKLAERYKTNKNVVGIELINEPRWDIPIKPLTKFYKQGYKEINKVNPNLNIIISDSFRPLAWNKNFNKDEFKNLILDMHMYQCFSEEDKKLNMHEHIDKTINEWKDLIIKVQKDIPVIIGEWSLGLDKQSLKGLTKFEKEQATKAYGLAQILTFEKSAGWFFWNYKTEDKGGWNFKHSVEQGYLPANFKLNLKHN